MVWFQSWFGIISSDRGCMKGGAMPNLESVNDDVNAAIVIGAGSPAVESGRDQQWGP